MSTLLLPPRAETYGDHRDFLLDHPEAFLAHYFPHRLGDGLQPPHLRLIENALGHYKSLTLFPATFGKSTIGAELLPLWGLCRDPNIRIAVIAKNDDEVAGIARSMMAEMLDNDDLVNDFGPFRHKERPWGTQRISVANRTRRGKSDTLAFFGSGAKTVLGYRTDWTICDDVVTAENSATPELRSKLSGWFNKSVATGPEHPEMGRLSVYGTRFHPDDLYAELEEKRSTYTGETIYSTRQEDAIVSEEDELTLWPARWSWRALMEKKDEVGTVDFNKRYRNIAVDESRILFREEWVKGGYGPNGDVFPGCIDWDYVVGDYDPAWNLISGFDPAASQKTRAKRSAHIVIAFASCPKHDHCLWIVDLERAQLSVPQQRDLVIAKHKQYGLFMSVFEANAYQAGLGEIIEEELARTGMVYNIQPHYTSDRNKPDPETGVSALVPWVVNGKMHIPWGDPESRRKMQWLLDDLIPYPAGRTTDCVMALWFAFRRGQEARPPAPSFNRLAGHQSGNRLLRQAGRSRLVANPAYAQSFSEVE